MKYEIIFLNTNYNEYSFFVCTKYNLRNYYFEKLFLKLFVPMIQLIILYCLCCFLNLVFSIGTVTLIFQFPILIHDSENLKYYIWGLSKESDIIWIWFNNRKPKRNSWPLRTDLELTQRKLIHAVYHIIVKTRFFWSVFRKTPKWGKHI